jgi:hypothetical protein
MTRWLFHVLRRLHRRLDPCSTTGLARRLRRLREDVARTERRLARRLRRSDRDRDRLERLGRLAEELRTLASRLEELDER